MIEKTYQPADMEKQWAQTWEEKSYFAPQGSGDPFCIMLPPPNVTGSLHMGHGFQHTLMDALIRYHRMCGDNTLWQPGTDHAGIATQLMVEQQLREQGSSRLEVGRPAFEKAVWAWKEKSGGQITRQMRRLGTSPDWSRERFTMDEGLSEAVLKAFVKLHKDGLIYRGKRLVNWDPVLRTALSDLEVIHSEEAGTLWHIRYPIVGTQDYITVATTRPETLFGDVAVAVHPEDPRYQKWIGKKLSLPLTEREIPIISDDTVLQEFGTGCVKITPAHDFNDYAMGQRHSLSSINILNLDATLNENVPAAYQGLDRFVARKKVLADLKAAELLTLEQAHTIKVPRAERGNTIVEPYLTDQWYVSMQEMANRALQAVEKGETQFVPANWKNTFDQWLTNIQDWCISRQLWWGHRIPAWYDETGQVYVGMSEAEVRQEHQLASTVVLRQEEDVLDTWFSSALWPFSTLGWPEKTEAFNTFFPTSILVTGFDIIFFWVARMMMFSLYFTNKVPFKVVYITGLIRDAEGQKMSKTKGNVLDPIDLIDGISLNDLIKKRTSGLIQPKMAERITQATQKEFSEGIPALGTDALRFTFCALANTGRDIRFDLPRVIGYRNFCNKLWNAARFVEMQCERAPHFPNISPQYSLADKWIRVRLQETVNTAHQYFTEYRFDLLAQTLYEFMWNDFCDWYLESVKPMFSETAAPESSETQAARETLIFVLENTLRLMHPIMPFITEEIWQNMRELHLQTSESVMRAPYPAACEISDLSEKYDMTDIQQVITTIRTLRSKMNVAPSKKVTVTLRTDKNTERFLNENLAYVSNLAKLSSLEFSTSDSENPAQSMADSLALSARPAFGNTSALPARSVDVFLHLKDLIDPQAECARLQKEMDKLNLELTKAEGKLNNPNYVNKAPAAVVAQEKERVTQWKNQLETLKAQWEQYR